MQFYTRGTDIACLGQKLLIWEEFTDNFMMVQMLQMTTDFCKDFCYELIFAYLLSIAAEACY